MWPWCATLTRRSHRLGAASQSVLALLLFAYLAATAASPPSRPSLGFNPCNGVGCHMAALGGEPVLRRLASSVAAALRPAGYDLFALDDGWQGPRTPSGLLTANSSAFSNSTLASLAAYVATLGLRLGAYTDRGALTCERYAGSLGREAADAATLVAWGVSYVKVDSCNASEVEADRRDEYRAMANGLAAAGDGSAALSICGWAPSYAAFGGLTPPLGASWRVGPDASSFARFLIGVEGAAGASPFAGAGRGVPDLELIGGAWSPTEERFRLSIIAVVGAPLLVSFDPANTSSFTLPLAAYTNPEIISLHQADTFNVTRDGAYYYARVAGGAVTGAAGAAPLVTAAPCDVPAAQWRYTPTGGGGGGTFESVGLPGYCLSAWDLIPNGGCKNPINAYLLPCGGADAGCAPSAGSTQTWMPRGGAEGWTLAVQYAPPPGAATHAALPRGDYAAAPMTRRGRRQGLSVNPWPGPFLTDSGVSGAPYLQPRGDSAASQAWVTAAAANASAPVATTIRGARGCLAAPPRMGGPSLWARWLPSGAVALLLANFDESGAAAAVECDAACLGRLADARPAEAPPPDGGWAVRDVWERADIGVVAPGAGYVTPQLQPGGGSQLVLLTPMPINRH